jgi:hypothetical protein
MMASYCQNCGTPLGESAKYCSNCGHEVTAERNEEAVLQPDHARPEPTVEAARPTGAEPASTPPPRTEKPKLLKSERSRYLAVFTLGIWLVIPYTVYLWRRGNRAAAVALGGVTLLALLIVISAIGSASNSTTSASATPTAAPLATDRKGNSCLKSKLDFAHRCPANSDYRKTKAQLRAEVVAKAKAAKRAKRAAARAAEVNRVRLARQAAAQRARIVAANAWHQGYTQQDENVYWRWVHGRNCQDYAQYGCWHVEVIARNGCPSYVAVQANEYSGASIINSMLDNQGYGIPPKTSRVFELDADQNGVTVDDLSVQCQ